MCLHCKVMEIDLAVPESNALFDELHLVQKKKTVPF